jgi:hypothetical protein
MVISCVKFKIFTYEILFSHTVATVQLFACEIEGLYVEMNFTCEMIISSVDFPKGWVTKHLLYTV